MGVLDAGLRWLSHTRRAHDGVAVNYVADGLTLAITAVPARVRRRREASDAFRLTARRADWLIHADELINAGERFEPQAGHRIHRVFEDGSEHLHEVMPPEPGEAAWDWSDGVGRTLRVHTRHVATIGPKHGAT